MLATEDTIVAIASAPGGALRGIVRVSGPACLAIAARWFQSQQQPLDSIARPTVVRGNALLKVTSDGSVPAREVPLPGELLVWPGRRSYTRQPTVEFHTLGSPPLLELLVQTICGCGARLAAPGEFTLRAFLAGRLDLTQAEAVLGVIDANSERELHVALRQLAGGLAHPLQQVRSDLLHTLAHLEAGLDFVEEDLEFISAAELRRQLLAAQVYIERMLAKVTTRAASANAYRVVLLGLPNAGKSSLLNALTGQQRAIVSESPGTTRDYVSASLEIEEMICELIDTAGRETVSAQASIEQAAQAARVEQSSGAHLRLLCIDATATLSEWQRSELSQPDEQRLVVFTKCDRPIHFPRTPSQSIAIGKHLDTSSSTGVGLAELRAAIAQHLRSYTAAEVVSGTAVRCRDSLMRASRNMAEAIDAHNANLGEELVAAELRLVLHELGAVAGTFDSDDILDRIFSRFCIGK